MMILMVSIPPKTRAQPVTEQSSLRDCDSFLFSSLFFSATVIHHLFFSGPRGSLSVFHAIAKTLSWQQAKSKWKPVSTGKQARKRATIMCTIVTFYITKSLSIFQHHHTALYQHVHFFNLFSFLYSNKRNIFLWFGKLHVRQSAKGKKWKGSIKTFRKSLTLSFFPADELEMLLRFLVSSYRINIFCIRAF